MISSISLFCYVVLNSKKILKPALLWIVEAIVPYSSVFIIKKVPFLRKVV